MLHVTLNETFVPLHFSYLFVNGSRTVYGLIKSGDAEVELRGISVECSLGPVCCKGAWDLQVKKSVVPPHLCVRLQFLKFCLGLAEGTGAV